MEVVGEEEPSRFAPDGYARLLSPPRRRSGTNRPYLCHFEELRQFGHPVEESLVDLQSFFALVLLHVKVFLCISEGHNQHNSFTNERKSFISSTDGCLHALKKFAENFLLCGIIIHAKS